MSSFLIDKKYAELYEKYVAETLKMEWNQTNKDDHGIDVFDVDKEIYIDVKCFSSPLYVEHFKGVFLETYLPRSGRDGWLIDESKQTTHYILFQDCDRNKVSYYQGWLIKREQLQKALDEAILVGEAEKKSISTAAGYMLPYHYLDGYSESKWQGDKYMNEMQKGA